MPALLGALCAGFTPTIRQSSLTPCVPAAYDRSTLEEQQMHVSVLGRIVAGVAVFRGRTVGRGLSAPIRSREH